MSASDPIRRGVANEGGFFSPYYLFDVMLRLHRDELDLEGRDRERRMLPRVYRRAMARLGDSATVGELWSAWLKELLHALGFESEALSDGVSTPRHGIVPVSHCLVAPGGGILALLDVHPPQVDLDRDTYDESTTSMDEVTPEAISRAFELALDAQESRWGLLTNGTELRLYRRGSTVSRQYLEVDFDALFDADRDDEWTAFWGIFRRQAFLPDTTSGKCLVDRVLEESQRHASRIAEDLRDNVVDALEALIQGILDEPENARLWGGGRPDATALERLFEESLYFLYRLLFILYAESRDVLPVGESQAYRETYSIEHLRSMAERELHADDARKTYYVETVRTLFRMLRKGFKSAEFEVLALGGRGPEDPDWETAKDGGDLHLTGLFDARRTRWLDECRVPDRAMRTVIRELSLSRPRRRSEHRERYSYADLGVDQLGSVYEGLLVYEPSIVTEDTVLAKVKGEVRLVTRTQADEHGFQVMDGSEKRPGSFVLRLWGGRRKGSGSYYTPEEITSFLVKEALQPIVDPIIARCRDAWTQETVRVKSEAQRTSTLVLPQPRTHIAEEILDIKVCDPAMGSGAFLIQACRYLANAYGLALIAEGRDESGRIEQQEMSRYKRLVAERCLYGVDLNPLAVELAKVSLWLETLSKGKPLSFLDAHLRCGNSLLSAPLRDAEGKFTVEHIAAIPTEALSLVSDDPPEAAAQRAREFVKQNRAFLKKRAAEKGKGLTRVLFGLDEGLLRSTLQAYLDRRAALDNGEGAAKDPFRRREEKERQFQEAYSATDAPVRKLREVCDLWCAAWFWPEEQEVPAFGSPEYREVIGRILRAQAVDAPCYETARRVAQEQRFFHWELEFPEVFLRERPGFDAMLGNPPWNTLEADALEMAADFDPGLVQLRGDERDARSRELLDDPQTGVVIRERIRTRAQTARFCSQSPYYRGLVAGKVNTFATFAVVAWKLHRQGGAMGVVLKEAFHLTESLGPLRAVMLREGRIRTLITSDNERKIFDAHHLMRFDLVVAGRGEQAASVPLRVHRFRTAREIVGDQQPATEIPISLLTASDGRFAEPVPEITDTLWPTLWEKAHRTARGGRTVRWTSELNSSSDKAFWTRGERPDGSPGPVLAVVGPFDALGYDPMAWLLPGVTEREDFHKKVIWGRWRVAVRDRADQKNERVLIGAIIPPNAATCDYLRICEEPTEDPCNVMVVAALASSLVLDYLARPFVGIHMSVGILNKLPWVLPADKSERAALIQEVARLTCIRPEFDELASLAKVQGEPHPEKRQHLRASIDARIARLYGLTAHEFARVLAWFRLLDQDQSAFEGEPKSTITRDLALREFFRQTEQKPPKDIVAFYGEAGVDLAPITGPLRDLDQRIKAWGTSGAIAYLPSGRGGGSARSDASDEPSTEEGALDAPPLGKSTARRSRRKPRGMC